MRTPQGHKRADASDADPSPRRVIACRAAEGLGRAAMRSHCTIDTSADPGNANAHAATGRILARDGRRAEALAEHGGDVLCVIIALR